MRILKIIFNKGEIICLEKNKFISFDRRVPKLQGLYAKENLNEESIYYEKRNFEIVIATITISLT